MIDSDRLGVFVGVLISRKFLCSILSLGVFVVISACSEPDERLPWPTAKDKMLKQSSGLWNSSCIPIIGVSDQQEVQSHNFEVTVYNSGYFVSKENQFLNDGCRGVAHDRRKREGQVDTVEEVSKETWKISAHMYEHGAPGDLMNAVVLVKMVNGQAHIKPLSATLFDVGKKIHEVWDDSDPVVWVLESLE